jgi:hypothetical protein
VSGTVRDDGHAYESTAIAVMIARCRCGRHIKGCDARASKVVGRHGGPASAKCRDSLAVARRSTPVVYPSSTNVIPLR